MSESAAPFVPDGADLDQLRAAAATCKGCHLWENATQTVFSRGSAGARVVMVGEQPGDVEDQRGEPFVGPAGVLLRRAVGDAGLSADDIYITNAVKHFKFPQVSPRVVVALGATAAQALLGPSFRVTKQRGILLPWPESAYHAEDFAQAGGSAKVMATLHPSAILRADDRDTAYAGLVDDLRVAASAL